MAMTTRTAKRKQPEASQASLKRRIRQFYDSLNRGDFARCFHMIDPRVRNQPSSVTLLQYENSLRQFLEKHGSIRIEELDLVLHLNEPSKLYEGRDFALGKTAWVEETGERHLFAERWVREGRTWYTRSTGFIVTGA
jgi:hypothetical protein